MFVNRLRPVLLVVAALGLVVGTGGVWVWAQPAVRTAAVGKFDAVLANPNYVVVNAPTQVLFTAKITDRQLKKRSVILLRTDAAGTPTDILGRLHDDGKNGDLRANDNIYSFRQTLTESVVGTATFRVAARFKPGKWTESESDDDDWDEELDSISKSGRDRPALSSLMKALLRRLSRYSLSETMSVDIWNRSRVSTASGLSLTYPPTWQAIPDASGIALTNAPASTPIDNDSLMNSAILTIRFYKAQNPLQLPISQWFESHFSNGFPSDLLDKQVMAVNSYPAIQIELSEIGRRRHIYFTRNADVFEITYGLQAAKYVPLYEAIVRSVQF